MRDGDADRKRHANVRDRPELIVDPAHTFADPPADLSGDLLIDTRQDHHELVAGVTGGNVAGTAGSDQDRGDGLEHLIADTVAEVVVDLLEVVDVDQRNRDRVTHSPAGAELVLKSLLERPPVYQPGQRVPPNLRDQPIDALAEKIDLLGQHGLALGDQILPHHDEDHDEKASRGGDGDPVLRQLAPLCLTAGERQQGEQRQRRRTLPDPEGQGLTRRPLVRHSSAGGGEPADRQLR